LLILTVGSVTAVSGVAQRSDAVRARNRRDLEELHELLEAGKVTPVVDRTLPLIDVPEAIRYLREGRARGKIVITV